MWFGFQENCQYVEVTQNCNPDISETVIVLELHSTEREEERN